MICERCDDTGFVRDGAGVVECPCRRERKLAQVIERSGIPPRYRSKTFEGYDTSGKPSSTNALLVCRRWLEEWPTNRHRGVLMQGPVGVGKTHLACAMLMGCHQRWGATISFVDLPELFTKIKATFDPAWAETEMEILRPLLAADVLAIDELAAARQSEWSFSMTEQILNSRYNADKSTIITTNFPNQPVGWKPAPIARPRIVAADVDFAARAGAISAVRQETLGDRIGARMFSRTMEMCLPLEMDGEDQRAVALRRRG